MTDTISHPAQPDQPPGPTESHTPSGPESDLTDLQRLHSLPWLIAGNTGLQAFCLLTFFGSMFVLFLNELGLDKTRIGFLLSLIPFAAVLAIFAAPWIARTGHKRITISCLVLRKCVTALLVLTPFVLTRYGPNLAFTWIAAIILIFAVLRSFAETAMYSWHSGLIPNQIRGKFGAINGILVHLISIIAALTVSFVVGHFTGLGRFLWLIAVGSLIGLAAVAGFAFLPGGAPQPHQNLNSAHFRALLAAARNRNFRLFTISTSIGIFAWSALVPFVPLYMKEQIALGADQVVLLDAGIYAGVFLSAYLWGWAADRYGSKPVFLTGLGLLSIIPLFWLILPRAQTSSFYLAMILALLAGAGSMGWGIGHQRYLFNTAVPPDKKTAYMPIWTTCMGIAAGAGPLLTGKLIDLCHGLKGQFGVIPIDPYTPFLTSIFALLLLSFLLQHRIDRDSNISTGRFVGMFFQGNPILAMSSMLRFRLARSESDRTSSTRHMGRARNPLNLQELIEALQDPSFNVRHEAVLSIAEMRPDPRLVDALVQVLGSGETDLSLTAAWALGKLSHPNAVVPLRETLRAEYPLMRARSARALAMLDDTQSICHLLDSLDHEPEPSVRVAYAAALGQLRADQAVPQIFALLRNTTEPTFRRELALAVARIVGQEHRYMKLWRDLHHDLGTAAAKALLALRRPVARLDSPARPLTQLLQQAAQSFAQAESTRAAQLLANFAQTLTDQPLPTTTTQILKECTTTRHQTTPLPIEYLTLTLHTITTQLRQNRIGPYPSKP